jgi:hypothetical protein
MRWLVLAACLIPAGASAQAVDLTRPDVIADELADVRRSHHVERREAGHVLFWTGLASVIAGGVVAGVMHDDPFALMFGLGTAGWGAVNAGLAIGLLDLGDGGFARIEADRTLRGEPLRAAREQALRSQEQSGAFFALNVGLDVFYVAAGILLFFLADQLDSEQDAQFLRGYSAAMTGQGAFLLGFDLIAWIASSARASRIAAIGAP